MDALKLGTSGAYEASLAGIQRGMQSVGSAATRLVDEVDINAIADLKMGEVQVKASVKAVKTVDDTLGHLLDAIA